VRHSSLVNVHGWVRFFKSAAPDRAITSACWTRLAAECPRPSKSLRTKAKSAYKFFLLRTGFPEESNILRSRFVPCGRTCTKPLQAWSAPLSQVWILANLPVPASHAEGLGVVCFISQSSSLYAMPASLFPFSFPTSPACGNCGTLPDPRDCFGGLVYRASRNPKSALSLDARTVQARYA
jgi:hypothetical protein